MVDISDAPPAYPTLAGKTAIVTGGSRGLGAGIAYELARRGARVIINYTSSSSEKLVDELILKIAALKNGSSGVKVQADISSLEAPAKVIAATVSESHPHIDILVNNAGTEVVRPLGEITAEDYSKAFDLNVRGTIMMTQAILPHLRAPGRIINISTIGSRAGFPGVSLYASSKAAIEGLTRCWAHELGDQGHTVNTVNPGPVRTELLARTVPEEAIQLTKALTAVGHRLGVPDDIAQIVGFLAEEGSRWITAQSISASGGFAQY
ncbi:dehydrogenase with different specificitie [Xylona heveae TC161]|uniref:Dehydrogenase with different specificitie n=1 Tax=Xylona heveae (strain CBS 132557 / TC161) TaxID=1328760 RepID=A0A165ACN6_XYLHT|nr:dehydrogenase with different specificitie [Xylona heveae TC161]KZF20259.1 dehydrogenase with different specificitie [Xylona heveae TC161]